jgi:Cdc6-like AAA superfamily ATPase
MIDTEAYKTFFPGSSIALSRLRDAIGTTRMRSDKPLEGDELLLFPPTIMGYNIQDKAWKTLWVDSIKDVKWNKTAFEDLVAEPDTKELVKAVIMNHIDTKKSTDFVSGKGNGLIMLLHGAPGTGKTFTAEGVAEFAEKPLLRVTCGDIGTVAETVDHRLGLIVKLGKMWDCGTLSKPFQVSCFNCALQWFSWTKQTSI